MKTFCSLTCLSLISALSLSAQVYTPPGGSGPTPTPAPAASSQKSSSGYSSSDQSKSLLGNEVPFLDATQETITFNGRTWPLGDTRLLAARYEKYLNELEDKSEEFQDYRKLIKLLIREVSPMTPGNSYDKLKKSTRIMQRASEFEMDAGLCNTIINAVHTACLSQQDVSFKKQSMDGLNEEYDRISRKLRLIEDRRDMKNVQDVKDAANKPKQQSIEFRLLEKRLAEIDVMKKKYETEASISSVQSKILYQALLVQLFLQRRFEHALIAAQLYNIIFKDGDSQLKVEKGSDAAKVFGETLGLPPTVSTIESLSQEIIKDTERAVGAIHLMIEKKQLTNANKRLSEAYFMGEYLEPIRTFSLSKKQDLYIYTKDLFALVNAVDAKDFTRANELLESLKASSKDFDPAKPSSYIEGMTRASDMNLVTAQKAMLDGDEAKAQESIKEAMLIWPKNPKLKDVDKTVVASSELVVAKKEFERLLKEENYRQIFKEQYRFAPIVQSDDVLKDAFEQIIKNTLEIEKSIAKAREFSNMGQPYAAWEELRLMRSKKVFSTDPELGKQLEELTPRVSDLASALDTAQRLEGDQEVGSSLTWYIKARNIYPNSKYANEGIERLMKRVFPN